MKKIVFVISALLIYTYTYSQSLWTFDKTHSKLGFSLIHLKDTLVKGVFKDFDVTLVTTKDDFTDAAIEVTANIKSISTNNSIRDNDLQGTQYFDSEKYPTLTFKSSSIEKTGNTKYKLKGNITIRGITKPIALDVVYNHNYNNQNSKNPRAVFIITGKLNGLDFGIGNQNMLLNHPVNLISTVEFIKN